MINKCKLILICLQIAFCSFVSSAPGSIGNLMAELHMLRRDFQQSKPIVVTDHQNTQEVFIKCQDGYREKCVFFADPLRVPIDLLNKLIENLESDKIKNLEYGDQFICGRNLYKSHESSLVVEFFRDHTEALFARLLQNVSLEESPTNLKLEELILFSRKQQIAYPEIILFASIKITANKETFKKDFPNLTQFLKGNKQSIENLLCLWKNRKKMGADRYINDLYHLFIVSYPLLGCDPHYSLPMHRDQYEKATRSVLGYVNQLLKEEATKDSQHTCPKKLEERITKSTPSSSSSDTPEQIEAQQQREQIDLKRKREAAEDELKNLVERHKTLAQENSQLITDLDTLKNKTPQVSNPQNISIVTFNTEGHSLEAIRSEIDLITRKNHDLIESNGSLKNKIEDLERRKANAAKAAAKTPANTGNTRRR